MQGCLYSRDASVENNVIRWRLLQHSVECYGTSSEWNCKKPLGNFQKNARRKDPGQTSAKLQMEVNEGRTSPLEQIIASIPERHVVNGIKHMKLPNQMIRRSTIKSQIYSISASVPEPTANSPFVTTKTAISHWIILYRCANPERHKCLWKRDDSGRKRGRRRPDGQGISQRRESGKTVNLCLQ